jgi:hypothetical protein
MKLGGVKRLPQVGEIGEIAPGMGQNLRPFSVMVVINELMDVVFHEFN